MPQICNQDPLGCVMLLVHTTIQVQTEVFIYHMKCCKLHFHDYNPEAEHGVFALCLNFVLFSSFLDDLVMAVY